MVPIHLIYLLQWGFCLGSGSVGSIGSGNGPPPALQSIFMVVDGAVIVVGEVMTVTGGVVTVTGVVTVVGCVVAAHTKNVFKIL